MSVVAGGYVLKVPAERRKTLINAADESRWEYGSPSRVAEPVPRFDHNRRAPLVVFASFSDGKVTHIAEGKRGLAAGTGLSRLNLLDLTRLERPIAFAELESGVPKGVRVHLRRILDHGGLLPPKTLGALVDRIMELDGSVRARLARFSDRRRDVVRRLRRRAAENLALQKEALGIALEIAGLSKDEVLSWHPADTAQRSFLDGLPGATVREDAMLLSDFSTIPGFEGIGEVTHYASKSFRKKEDRSVRLTVVMANRLPLEQQTGADLIYFNETYKSFVMVQYKAMEKGTDEAEFRWSAGDQFEEEVRRMDDLLNELAKVTSGQDPDGYRFCENPFFLKFCPRAVLNPDDSGLFKGIYLPLDLWKRAFANGRLKGQKGGNLLTFSNVGRRINNSEFVTLVAGSWVGTTIEQSAILGDLVKAVLEAGKTVTFAIRHADRLHRPDVAAGPGPEVINASALFGQ